MLTSHHWDEIEAICTSIAMIDRGETVLAGRIDAVRARARITRLAFDLPPDLVPPLWLGARHDSARWQIDSTDSDADLRRMVAEGLPFANLPLRPLDLKDLIQHLRHTPQNTPQTNPQHTPHQNPHQIPHHKDSRP